MDVNDSLHGRDDGEDREAGDDDEERYFPEQEPEHEKGDPLRPFEEPDAAVDAEALGPGSRIAGEK